MSQFEQTFEKSLEQYAELVVKVGVNIQKGQDLLVTAPIETLEFTRLIVQKAYAAGANYVQVDFDDDNITRSRFEHGSNDSFDYYPAWKADMMEKFAEAGGATLTIKVPDPELYNGIDSDSVSRATKAAAHARRGYAKYTRNHEISWCLIKAPTKAWANEDDLPTSRKKTEST